MKFINMHAATLGDRKIRILTEKGEKIAQKQIYNYIVAKGVRAFSPTRGVTVNHGSNSMSLSCLPSQLTKQMYSISCKKRKPLDLSEVLLLKICPNVTDFYPKNGSS